MKLRNWAQLSFTSESAVSLSKEGDFSNYTVTVPGSQHCCASIIQTDKLKEGVPQTEEDMIYGLKLPYIRRKQKIFQK